MDLIFENLEKLQVDIDTTATSDVEIVHMIDNLACIVGDLTSKVSEIDKKLKEVDQAAYSAANTASCLANGIIPD